METIRTQTFSSERTKSKTRSAARLLNSEPSVAIRIFMIFDLKITSSNIEIARRVPLGGRTAKTYQQGSKSIESGYRMCLRAKFPTVDACFSAHVARSFMAGPGI